MTTTADRLALAGLPIVIRSADHETTRFAAAELARYLRLLTGETSAVSRRAPKQGAVIALDHDTRTGEQGYRVEVKRRGQQRDLVIGAASPVGQLYGVYGLLEHLGVGFYNGGDALPETPLEVDLPLDFALAAEPAFGARGNMLHYNFLCGCTTWGLADYQFYFDQLARQRMNVLLMHWYDGEPGAGYELEGEYLAGGTTPNSLTKPWGALEALRTSQFSFGVGRCFDEEVFTAPPGVDVPDLVTELKQTEAVFRRATRYAKVRGIRVAAGFEAPGGHGDPTDPTTIARFQARLRQFLARNPELTYFALWQHESGGCTGTRPPALDTAAGRLYASRRAEYAALGNEKRIWEAIRYGEFARLAAELLAQEAPHLRLVVVGWGGDRWMRFADYCLIYDRLLPQSVIFTCHDNIDASFGPNVSTPWGQLPPARERWAMPWVEGDIEDCWTRQPQVEALGLLCPDALAKGCQGLLNLQWRTRDVEEENAYIARFAWDPTLTPARFYRTLARDTVGAAHEAAMAELYATLQRHGARWTGVHGTMECSRMVWTGWAPHFPFELDRDAVAYLIPKAEKAAEVLAILPPPEEDPQAGAFHLRQEAGGDTGSDTTRFGVAEMADIAAQLRQLHASGVSDPEQLRARLLAIREQTYAIRYDLVTFGMIGAGYQAMDMFLFALHHLVRVAGYKAKSARLRELRRQVDVLAEACRRGGQVARLERLDYLAATMDFVLHYDAAAVLLADGEAIEQALAAARGAEPELAARRAAEAYRHLVNAGMADAVRALTRKLTTRCDWGLLATVCVKPLPLYWRTLEQLESLLPAVPPREVAARGLASEVWLSWTPSAKAHAYRLYRRAVGGQWQLTSRQPLNLACPMFIDRPGAGTWEYALSALAKDGWESPLSHPSAAVACGPRSPGPRILACQPPGQLLAGEPLHVRVVVLSERELESVALVYRPAGEEEWWSLPLHHRFRDSYQGVLPAEELVPGTLEWYVEALDEDGGRTLWPAAAEAARPWTTIVSE